MYTDHALGISIMQFLFLNNAALFNVQVREEDCPNQYKDWENGARYENQRGSKDSSIGHLKDQLSWSQNISCMVQTPGSSNWEGEFVCGFRPTASQVRTHIDPLIRNHNAFYCILLQSKTDELIKLHLLKDGRIPINLLCRTWDERGLWAFWLNTWNFFPELLADHSNQRGLWAFYWTPETSYKWRLVWKNLVIYMKYIISSADIQ